MAQNFITNAPGAQSLKSRLETLIHHSETLKFLVGFFYFSGWRELYQALKARDDLAIYILVGLEADARLGRVIEVADAQAAVRSQAELAEQFYASLRAALNDVKLDTAEFYEQAAFFLEMLDAGRLHIRKTLDPTHAKLYLFALDEAARKLTNVPGRFITGSSNFTRSGLIGQQEFNVEIGDYGWEDAAAYFDDLWASAVPLSEYAPYRKTIRRIIRRQTQVAEITPFEAYALILKAYLDLMAQKKIAPTVRQMMEDRGYTAYRYQLDAVQQALSVIGSYQGVILADVVGLGKSVIASLLARQLGGRGLVLCPPALMGDAKTRGSGWYQYLSDFGLYDWDVYSVGALDKVQAYLEKYGDDVQAIIVDEAHRFRNEDTASYEALSQICTNRTVILLTATPFNNTPADIFALLKLFIPPGKSTLTLDEDLAARFRSYHAEFRRISYILRYHDATGDRQARAEGYYEDLFEVPPPIDVVRVRRRARHLADEIRAVIEPVVIRRNRLDLQRDPLYAQEVSQLSDVADPRELFFELSSAQSTFYDRVIHDYFGDAGQFRGAIYQPFAYEQRRALADSELDEASNRTYQQQRNLYNFMRRLLVKRFESSFGAFVQSIANFIRVHECVLAFIENSGGRYVLDRDLIEKVYAADPEEIEAALAEFARDLAEKAQPNPRHDRIYHVDNFQDRAGFLHDIRADLDLLRQIATRVQALDLVEHDPKLARLEEAARDILTMPPQSGEPRRKLVIFSEYVDTVKYIAPVLEAAFPGRVLVCPGTLTQSLSQAILENFDASVEPARQRDDFDILLTSDKLAEGVNLNRAGAIINYDIPWNPTRVIQRVGRINRIGRKVFETLYIYNFFPTEQGADVVHSREIAAQKMFLIHNTLGEDAKILAADESPSPAALFQRVNRHPDEEEEESLLTTIRRQFFALQKAHPELVERLADFPPRVKTAKDYEANELLVFRRKGLQIFVHLAADTHATPPDIHPLTLIEGLPHVACEFNTPRLPLSEHFWPAYEAIKQHREHIPMPKSDIALETKAENNLRSALSYHAAALADDAAFIRTLLRDMKEYQTLSKYTLRRLTVAEMHEKASQRDIARFRREIAAIRTALGEDYLERIEQRLQAFHSEIIIAMENIGEAGDVQSKLL